MPATQERALRGSSVASDRRFGSSNVTSHRTLLAAVLLATLGAILPGCSALGIQIRSPITLVKDETRFGPGQLTAAAIQSEVMSFTDTFDSSVAEQWNRVAAAGRAAALPGEDGLSRADPERASRLRRAAIENKLATVSAALSIASSPNPTVALADMITLVTLQRMTLESPAAAERYGEELAGDLVAMYREQEAKIWRTGARAMSVSQQDELKELIAEWREQNPDTLYVATVRLEDFARGRQQSLVDPKESGDSLLSLIALDPLAGLDPAQREVQESRMLGERMFFYASRMPQVLKWQVESLYQDLLRAPEFERVMSSMDKVTESMARVSAVTERWPEDLEKARGDIQSTLVEFRETAEVTDKAAATLTTTIHAADEFAARFKAGPDSPANSDEPRRNVFAEYQAAVAQTGDAADRLTALAQNLDELLEPTTAGEESSKLQAAVVDVQSSAKSVIDYAFVRLLALVLLAPLAIALAVGLYRRATRRDAARHVVGSSVTDGRSVEGHSASVRD